ncbi:Inner membrane assembly complex subunit 17 protein [Rutstroemia sp. NJR-2017a BVV2]|nr:Inner membrane assembly complex subunit 17 protein [Rutstroemia sp. NJR-2017a BVV2]
MEGFADASTSVAEYPPETFRIFGNACSYYRITYSMFRVFFYFFCMLPGWEPLTNLPQRNFYKTFTRPVAKVLLMAAFTYQLVYWGWVKLEKNEMMEDKRREIRGLEETLERVSGGKVKGEDIRYKGL